MDYASNEAIQQTPQDTQSTYIAERTIPAEPQPSQSNLMRLVTITQLSYGYNVQVGCQTFAIETMEKVIANLASYMANPQQLEEKWFRKELKF